MNTFFYSRKTPQPNTASFRSTPPRTHHHSSPATTISRPPKAPDSASAIPSTSYPIPAPAKAHWTASTIFQPPRRCSQPPSFVSTRPLRVSPTRWSTSWRRAPVHPAGSVASRADWSPGGGWRTPSIRTWCPLRWPIASRCRYIRAWRRKSFRANWSRGCRCCWCSRSTAATWSARWV